MLPIPQQCIHTRSTPFWNKDTAPASILKRHLDAGTQPVVYPRLSVMQGTVSYQVFLAADAPMPDSEKRIEAGGVLGDDTRSMAAYRAVDRR